MTNSHSRPRISSTSRALSTLLALLVLAAAPLVAAKLSSGQEEWLAKVRILMSPDQIEEYERRPSSFQDDFWEQGLPARLFPKATPQERERVWMKRVEHAAEAFDDESWEDSEGNTVEPKGWLTQRGLVFSLIMGPPSARYVNQEPMPEDELEINDVQGLTDHFQEQAGRKAETSATQGASGLGGLSLGGGLGGLSLGGDQGEKVRVERWVYPLGGGQARILVFADKSGQMSLVEDKTMTLAQAKKGQEIAYRDPESPWYPRSSALTELGEAPELEKAAEAEVTTYVFRSQVPGVAHVRAVASVDPGDLKEMGLESADLMKDAQLWVTVKDADGRTVDRVRHEITSRNLDTEAGVVLEAPLELRPGIYDLNIVVAADGKGAAGSARVEIGDLEGGLALSSLVLTPTVKKVGDQHTLVSAASGDRLASKAGGVPSPEALAFNYGGYRMIPEVDGTFTEDQVLALFFQVYGKGTTTVDYSIYLDGQLAGEWEQDTVSPDKGGNLVRIQPLAGFPQGDYEIKVVARNEATGRELARSVEFEIE